MGMLMRKMLATGLVAGSLIVMPAAAQPTSTNSISLQAKLTGVPDGTASLAVRFYDSLTGGVQVGATITLNAVPVQGGIVSVPVSPVDASIFNGATRYMGIRVNGGAELSPRTLVTSVPYATSAQVLGGGVVTVDRTTGNVGIGTPTPNSSAGHLPTLHIEGFSPGIKLRDIEPADASGYELFVNSGSLSVLNNHLGAVTVCTTREGNVGIGTATPNSSVGHLPTLHIEGSSPGIKLRDIDPGEGSGFELYVNAGYFSVLNNRFGTVPLRVSSDNETIVSVLTITGGSDVAEPIAITPTNAVAKAEPGMVMVIDRDHDGKLVPCSAAYDKAVVGVLSGGNGLKPGMVLSAEGQAHTSGGDDTMPLAMTGRVWVWCDATVNPVRRGDSLTTSATPGHAMTVTDEDRAARAVIGKAMTELKEGRGLVLVLVNLQ
ncbi:MAG: hypothetical protein JSR77_00885 [Planctomycetes bacterium]|nr:hypothetical protein [Planctomycetota bacterium]